MARLKFLSQGRLIFSSCRQLMQYPLIRWVFSECSGDGAFDGMRDVVEMVSIPVLTDEGID